jgi:hypothetical protein
MAAESSTMRIVLGIYEASEPDLAPHRKRANSHQMNDKNIIVSIGDNRLNC